VSADCTGLASTLGRLSLSSDTATQEAPPQVVVAEDDSMTRRRAWEAGHVDYMGDDAFTEIQKKLDAAMGSS